MNYKEQKEVRKAAGKKVGQAINAIYAGNTDPRVFDRGVTAMQTGLKAKVGIAPTETAK